MESTVHSQMRGHESIWGDGEGCLPGCLGRQLKNAIISILYFPPSSGGGGGCLCETCYDDTDFSWRCRKQ